ncbi:MAG: HAMP domain-containing histidine kinase [Lachnospiraceae bacterium]|nr:HAMP domain-containing histidine kinase [Lachnospiraceae bacterium]
MKYRNRIWIAFVLVMLAALAVLWGLTKEKSGERRDMVAYNDELHRMYAEYREGRTAAELEAKYGCEIVLDGSSDAQVVKAYAEYGLVMDFAPDGERIGKVVWNDVRDRQEELHRATRRTALILWGVLFVAGLLFLLALDYYLLRPMREMRGVAGEIAKGNLDVPLPIRKHNPFGNLAESFDLMREELRASKEREAESEKAKKELVAELAHDIKTPVATIRATCEVLEVKQQRRIEQATAPESVAEAQDVLTKTQTIAHKADMIDTLIGSVFAATLEELDHVEVNPTEENSTVIEEYFRNLRNYGNIILENPIPSCLVYMDRLRMEQVIDNVVGNSHKYAGTDIRVSFDETTGKDRDGGSLTYISVRIRDDGPGAPEDELPLLTSKYYRGSTAKDKAGFGMGLYLVRSYMEKQGGGMEIYNDNGFVVTLYLRKV